MRNVYNDAERAKDKKAALGADITIENFTDETVNALDMIELKKTTGLDHFYKLIKVIFLPITPCLTQLR